ncbi:hypothetical protein GGTG_08362 [Gaeumannomyces tritici R3-111a-1]|uniref:Uncharacterized protein n=1 Tax=Gaeumannomyces tritici (strain R3-111a-1) TaxID=644352 RepID=J3P4C6_GAET3|nr:hypothetical protein GGTG_08362 [Gaeumannomyces tritici R3-111a-1]EJT74522.1 hypothetical protein GGTG_08362 [Gaeumannomyces tritici R3-111a-1]
MYVGEEKHVSKRQLVAAPGFSSELGSGDPGTGDVGDRRRCEVGRVQTGGQCTLCLQTLRLATRLSIALGAIHPVQIQIPGTTTVDG